MYRGFEKEIALAKPVVRYHKNIALDKVYTFLYSKFVLGIEADMHLHRPFLCSTHY